MKKKVLLIEDEKALGEAMKNSLSKSYDVTWCQDTDQASSHILDTDIILLDIILPGKDGLEFLQQLRQDPNTKDLKVIMLTNLDRGQEQERADALGVSDYAVKANLDISKLEGLIEKHI